MTVLCGIYVQLVDQIQHVGDEHDTLMRQLKSQIAHARKMMQKLYDDDKSLRASFEARGYSPLQREEGRYAVLPNLQEAQKLYNVVP
jgi:CHASE2 domain-containing sensor protein